MTQHREQVYQIREVARLTGLSALRLRAWERRYALVRPKRLSNRYRVYSEEQVAMLRAFARLVGGGERIGRLAASPDVAIARAEQQVAGDPVLQQILEAIRSLDRLRLETILNRELGRLSGPEFAKTIVQPLATLVGDQWALGRLPVAAEHLASEVVVHQLKGILRAPVTGAPPLLLAACLPGERHEWGLLSTLVGIRECGWRVEYLGADLPVDDLIRAAWSLRPVCIALTASDRLSIRSTLRMLRRLPGRLPPGAGLAIGGGGAQLYHKSLRSAGFMVGDEILGLIHSRGRTAAPPARARLDDSTSPRAYSRPNA